MFVKYQMKGGIGNTDWSTLNLLLADIQGILNGTITATSGFNSNVADISSCELSGSINTNIYHSVSKHNSTGTTDEGYVVFKKRHHHYLTDSNYDWERWNYLILGMDGSGDVPSFISRNKGAGNGRPQTTITGASWLSTENITFRMSNAPIFYFFISDYNFMWTLYDPTMDHGSQGGVLDYEITDADKHAFDNVTANYCPMYVWALEVANNYQEIGVTATDYQSFYLGRTDYLSNVGSVQSHDGWSTNAENALFGRTQYDASPYPSLYPTPYKRMMSAALPNGDSAHQLHPVFVSPHSNSDTNSDPIMGKFPYIWRTTDDIGYTGQTITFNGVDYVVMVSHKTGGLTDNDQNDNWANSCYLFRKTIGGN